MVARMLVAKGHPRVSARAPLIESTQHRSVTILLVVLEVSAAAAFSLSYLLEIFYFFCWFHYSYWWWEQSQSAEKNDGFLHWKYTAQVGYNTTSSTRSKHGGSSSSSSSSIDSLDAGRRKYGESYLPYSGAVGGSSIVLYAGPSIVAVTPFRQSSQAPVLKLSSKHFFHGGSSPK